MAEHRLPVSGTTSDGKSVSIEEIDTGCLTQVAGWESFEPAAGALLDGLGLALPGDYRSPARHGRFTAWRIAPDKVLVQSETPIIAAGFEDIVTLDLSQARVCIALSGIGAADLLSRVMTLDFSEAAFPSGTFAQGSLHHVGVLVERSQADAFQILIPTTWADSLIGLLVDHLRSVVAKEHSA